MPVKATAQKTIDAPTHVVWEILDEFGGISSWSAGIQNSYITGDTALATGEGAERRCELGGKKVLDERITAYTPGERMTIDVWNVEGLPLKSSQATFAVRADGDKTIASVDAIAEPKLPGFLVRLAAPLLSKGVAKQFGALLDELGAEAESRVRS